MPINTDSWDDESDWDGDKEAQKAPASAPVYLPSTKSAMIPKGKKSPPMTPKVAAAEPSSFTVEELIAEQQKNSYAPAITSLSLSKPKSAAAKVKQKKEAKKSDDDIFASMGLASVPSKGSMNSQKAERTTVSAPVKSNWKNDNLALAESVDLDTGSNWGDDGDLDDLLDE